MAERSPDVVIEGRSPWLEAELGRAREALAHDAALLEAIPAVLLVCDAGWTIRDVRGPVDTLLQMTREALIGRAIGSLIHPDDARHLPSSPLRGPGIERRTVARVHHGEESWVLAELEPVDRLDHSAVRGRLVLVRPAAAAAHSAHAAADHAAQLDRVTSLAPVAVLTCDARGVVTSARGAGLASVGVHPADVVGRDISELVAPRAELARLVRRALEGKPVSHRLEYRERTFDATLEPCTGAGGEVTGLIGVAVDVTERVRAARTATAAQPEAGGRPDARFDGLGSELGAVAVYDPAGRIEYVSPPLRRLLGRGPQERMRRAGDIAVHMDDLPRLERLFHEASLGSTPQTAVLRLQHREGRWVWVEASAGIELDPHTGTPVRTLTILRDVTEERRRLLSHVVAAHEEERTRIANDVHDDTVQAFATVDLKLGQLRRHLGEPRQLELADELRDIVRGAVERLRGLLFSLQPPGFRRGGLAGAIGDFAEGLFEGGPTTLSVKADLGDEPSPDAAVVVYRVLQEALTNAQRHAAATTVALRLAARDGGILAIVDDDGVGFDPVAAPARPGHRGLQTMRERAEMAGGWHRVESAPGRGTTVTVWVPDRPAQTPAMGVSDRRS